MAELFRASGRYGEAEPLFQQDLEISRKVLGEEHPEFAITCNNLALLYEATGRYEEAEPLLQQAVEILAAAFGREHPSTKTVVANLERFLKERSSGD